MTQNNDALLDPNMPADQLRLHMGELTVNEALVARAAIAWANTRAPIPEGYALMPVDDLKKIEDTVSFIYRNISERHGFPDETVQYVSLDLLSKLKAMIAAAERE